MIWLTWRQFRGQALTAATVPFLLLSFNAPRLTGPRGNAERVSAGVLLLSAIYIAYNESLANWQSLWLCLVLLALAFILARVRAAPGEPRQGVDVGSGCASPSRRQRVNPFMARILALSSHVVRGHVGLGATVTALQYLGHEVWAVPTVLLAIRPGLCRPVRYELPSPRVSAVLDALRSDGCWSALGAVFAGYFPSPRSVTAAARAIAAIKADRPGIVVFVDPILGDAGRLYVAAETAEAVRRELVPLASVVSPNRFELEWLTGARVSTLEEAVVAARLLGPACVVVTS